MEGQANTLVKHQTSQFNEVALLTLFFCALFPPAALFTGLVSRGQIKKSGERGKSFSTTGIVLGSISWAFIVLFLILIIIAAATSEPSSPRYYY